MEASRIILELTPEVTAELDRVKSLTGMQNNEVFGHAFTLLRIYLKAQEEAGEVHLVSETGRERFRIELPFEVRR